MAHGFRRPRRSSTSPSRRSTVRCAVTASDRPTRRLLRPAQRWHELGPPSARREIVRAIGNCRNSKEALLAIAAGFDVHRAQITFDALGTATGEVMRGRIDATPAAVARWAARFAGQRIDVAVEACTGWLFVCDALTAAGAVPHLAEPVEARVARSQAPRQDRSRGRALAARAARRRPFARGVDSAQARAPVALAGAAAPHADRRAHAVDAAHP